MYCIKCGTQNPEDAVYCWKCGLPLFRTSGVSGAIAASVQSEPLESSSSTQPGAVPAQTVPPTKPRRKLFHRTKTEKRKMQDPSAQPETAPRSPSLSVSSDVAPIAISNETPPEPSGSPASFVVPMSDSDHASPTVSVEVAERLESLSCIDASAALSGDTADASHTMLYDDVVDSATVFDEQDAEEIDKTIPVRRVILTESDGTAHEVTMSSAQPTIIIGRDPDLSDVVLEDERASRKHSQLTLDLDGMVVSVVDLTSSNGTWVNGGKISEAHQLNEGDILRVGRTEFTVTSPER